eukprot:1881590-Heterocapsa_arctica.AAC.1
MSGWSKCGVVATCSCCGGGVVPRASAMSGRGIPSPARCCTQPAVGCGTAEEVALATSIFVPRTTSIF